MLETIIGWITEAVGSMFDAIIELFLGCLQMSLNQLISVFPFLVSGYTVFQYIGIGLIVVMASWQLMKFFAGDLVELSDTPLQILIRSFIAGMLIWWGGWILNYIVEIAQIPYNYIVGMSGVTWTNSLASMADDLTGSWVNDLVGVASGGISSGAELILALVLILMIGWNLLKLLIEICERYLLVGVLTYCSPLIYPFLSSKSTSSVFKKWFGMFCGQCAIMSLSAWSLKLVVSGMSYTSAASGLNSFMRMMLTLAMCKIAQRIDTYMQQLGIGVATTGGNLFDEVVGTLMSWGNVTDKIAGGAGGSEKSSGSAVLGAVKSGDGTVLENLGNFGAVGAVKNAARGWQMGKLNGESVGTRASHLARDLKNGAVPGGAGKITKNDLNAKSKEVADKQKQLNKEAQNQGIKLSNSGASASANAVQNARSAKELNRIEQAGRNVGGTTKDANGRSQLDADAQNAGLKWDNNYADVKNGQTKAGDVLSRSEAEAFNQKIEEQGLDPSLKARADEGLTEQQSNMFNEMFHSSADVNGIKGDSGAVSQHIAENLDNAPEDARAAYESTVADSPLVASGLLFDSDKEISGEENEKLVDNAIKSAIGEEAITGQTGGTFRNGQVENTENGGRVVSADYYDKDGNYVNSYKMYDSVALDGKDAAVPQNQQLVEGLTGQMYGARINESGASITAEKVNKKDALPDLSQNPDAQQNTVPTPTTSTYQGDSSFAPTMEKHFGETLRNDGNENANVVGNALANGNVSDGTLTQHDDGISKGNEFAFNVNDANGNVVGAASIVDDARYEQMKSAGQDVSNYSGFTGPSGKQFYVGYDDASKQASAAGQQSQSFGSQSSTEGQQGQSFGSQSSSGMTVQTQQGSASNIPAMNRDFGAGLREQSGDASVVGNALQDGNVSGIVSKQYDDGNTKGYETSFNVTSPNGDVVGSASIVDSDRYNQMQASGQDVSNYSGFEGPHGEQYYVDYNSGSAQADGGSAINSGASVVTPDSSGGSSFSENVDVGQGASPQGYSGGGSDVSGSVVTPNVSNDVPTGGDYGNVQYAQTGTDYVTPSSSGIGIENAQPSSGDSGGTIDVSAPAASSGGSDSSFDNNYVPASGGSGSSFDSNYVPSSGGSDSGGAVNVSSPSGSFDSSGDSGGSINTPVSRSEPSYVPSSSGSSDNVGSSGGSFGGGNSNFVPSSSGSSGGSSGSSNNRVDVQVSPSSGGSSGSSYVPSSSGNSGQPKITVEPTSAPSGTRKAASGGSQNQGRSNYTPSTPASGSSGTSGSSGSSGGGTFGGSNGGTVVHTSKSGSSSSGSKSGGKSGGGFVPHSTERSADTTIGNTQRKDVSNYLDFSDFTEKQKDERDARARRKNKKK